MRKLILTAAVLGFAGLASTKANTINHSATATYAVVQDSLKKTPVKLEELPEAVKATLASDALKEWTPTTATLVTDAAGKEYYQIDVKKADVVKFVKLDKDGKPLA